MSCASCARKPDDAKISSDIQAKFSQDSGLSGKQITVQASNGTVTLEGAVDNDAQRDAAMAVADRVVVLNSGRKIAEGTPAEALEHAAVVQVYLGRT